MILRKETSFLICRVPGARIVIAWKLGVDCGGARLYKIIGLTTLYFGGIDKENVRWRRTQLFIHTVSLITSIPNAANINY